MPEWAVDAPAGTLVALSGEGGVRVDPTRERDDGTGAPVVTFGRNAASVDVALGTNDPEVARAQGQFRWTGRSWNLTNLGRRPIQTRESLLVHQGHELLLPEGYSPLFLRSTRREHLLEVLVVGAGRRRGPSSADTSTLPTQWAISARERLVMVVMAQRYLRFEADPQPATWRELASRLDELEPDEHWTAKKAEYVVARLRDRLTARAVAGLRQEKFDHPVGNSLNHNLIRELLSTGTVAPPDLALLDPPDTS